MILPLAFVPVYWARNDRWTELADVSTALVSQFGTVIEGSPEDWRVIVVDDPATRASVAAALGWPLPDAVELVYGKRPHVWLVPPPGDSDPATWSNAPADAHAALALRNNRVTREPVAPHIGVLAAELH